MAKRAKWVFVIKENADKYIGENGGTAVKFENGRRFSKRLMKTSMPERR